MQRRWEASAVPETPPARIVASITRGTIQKNHNSMWGFEGGQLASWKAENSIPACPGTVSDGEFGWGGTLVKL